MTLTSLANNLANATVLKSIATTHRVETEQTSEIHLHQSIFKPAVLNPLDPQLSEVIRQRFPSQSHYIRDMTQLKFPEFTDDTTTENKDQRATYLETEQPYPNNVLHDREVVHQVIGSYIVRPAFDSPASPTPELYKEPQLPPPSSQHHPQRLDGSYIATLALAPQFLGSGMGSLLLFSCIEFCKLNYNPRFVSLHVLASNTRAIALYTRFGFIIQQRVPMFQFPAHLIGVPAAQKDQHEINKHGLVLLEDGAILRQSYVLPPDETGDVLFLYLDIEQWNTNHQHIVSKWMESKLHLHVK
jgi:ribosomal protein S18 acetylase RimI-like enzyme